MAVTESNGNGYALYNGVKLPNIDTVWTDKQTYPYAFISSVEFDEIGTVYSLNLWSVNPPNGQTITSPIHYARYSFAYGVVDDWTLDDSGSINSGTVTKSGSFWTSHDILNTDGSVYFSASSPIPLDGMTVIEWDGVTDGLVNEYSLYYRIADYESSSAGIGVITRGEYKFIGTKYVFFDGLWCVQGDKLPELAFFASDSDAESFGLLQGGIYAFAADDDGTYAYTSLLAYTPAGSEPEEEPDEPYTNTTPPTLPTYNSTTYPYYLLQFNYEEGATDWYQVHLLYASDPFVYNGAIKGSVATYGQQTYGTTTSVWSYGIDGEFADNGLELNLTPGLNGSVFTRIYTNHDIKDSSGNVYLAADTVTPIEEETPDTPTNFDLKGFKTGLALGLAGKPLPLKEVE